MKNMIMTLVLICPFLAFGKAADTKKNKPDRNTASIADARSPMLAGYNLLQKLSDAGVLPPPSDLQNVIITMKIEQRGGGYYMFFTLKGPRMANTLNCSAPLGDKDPLDFDVATCERSMGG